MRNAEPGHKPSTISPVIQAFKSCHRAFAGVAAFSITINLLSLTGSIYMLQVYDRVLTSHSVETLIGISFLAMTAYLLSGALDSIRYRMLGRIGARFAESLAARVYEGVTSLPLKGVRPALAVQAIRDLDQIQRFLSSGTPVALLDAPFMPLFLLGCFLLHPWLGTLTMFGGATILSLTALVELRTREPTLGATISAAAREAIVESSARNAAALKAMGMRTAFAQRFGNAHRRHSMHSLETTESTAGLAAFARVFRAMLQSAVLGLGSYLALRGEVSPGAMIAASILTARALSPIESVVAKWRGIVAARHGYERLDRLFQELDTEDFRLELPRPTSTLRIEGLTVAAPGVAKAVIQGVSFELLAGQGLAVIGPSASGKSSLARALTGVWPAARGKVRLDGASLDRWPSERLGKYIGYLPQDVELFDGTVAENIARFDSAAQDDQIIDAARQAGAHGMILRLPQGYETRVGEQGCVLSAGQRQRLGLARALFGNPFLVVLDEPNSNLDAEGDDALAKALLSVRSRGGIAVVITHRPAALAGVNLVAVLADGALRSFGEKDAVLRPQASRSWSRPSERSPDLVAANAK
jgi:ATP-binding cassette subfamily C protein PrsD